MVAIKFTFTANRYHATQWGRHVNEGVLEWPPSPWRMLRGIVATWRRTLPELPSERVEPILEALALEYPGFHLPPASTGHTRHYMPYNEGTRERTTLVLDPFVAIQPKKSLFAVWPNVSLDSQQQSDLERILRNMPYLGRAESWVEASIATDHPKPNSCAVESGLFPEGDWEVVRTLVPHSHIGLKELQVETSELRVEGRIDPQGAHWYPYVRRRDCFTSFQTDRPRRTARSEGATVVRFALSGKVLPMAFDTLRWGEVARKAAMSKFGRQNDGAASEALSGKDAAKNPLRGHRHAFYLPTDEDGDGRLDHLTVWAPGGLDASAIRAVFAMEELAHPKGQGDPLQLAYQAHGKADDFIGVSRLFDTSKRWRSLTPYVLTRHRKRDSDSPEEQVAREAALRWEGRRLRSVRVKHPRKHMAPMRQGRSDGFRPFDFFTYRQGGGSNAGGAFNFELKFEEEVCGPIALGFACHYGLGLFVPSCD
ncbi:MAG: type I-U CRISPR-associated protein Csb2 [Chloroflexi bacterium]|nr:type I-U CRISPR-associated protein Csb2 [Chloroflexota bacterium]